MCFDSSKKLFYKSFNAIFGMIGRSSTADIVINMSKVKYLPVILYGLNACPLSAIENKILDFVIYRTLAKIVILSPSYLISWYVILHLIIIYSKSLHQIQNAK